MSSSHDDRKTSNDYDLHKTSSLEEPIYLPISTSCSVQNFAGAGSSYYSNSNRFSTFQKPSSSFPLMIGQSSPRRKKKKNCARVSCCGRFRGLILIIGFVTLFFLVDWWMLYQIVHSGFSQKPESSNNQTNLVSDVIIEEDRAKVAEVEGHHKIMFGRLLEVAANALVEGQNKSEPHGLWEEPFALASGWKPCADQRDWQPSEGNNGYVMVTANGGLNQQRVAVCNAVAVARLLNSTLVIPKFMYSSVWKDVSVEEFLPYNWEVF